ncbi:MAG: hypothetical protein J5746_00250 [Victivallales bacterium]|nr:hypothetical protein [Victivallales bacterium]
MFANSAVLASGCEAFDRFWANYCYLFMDRGWHVSAGQGWMPVAELLE